MMNTSYLRKIPASYLFEGMPLTEAIYDFSGNCLLIPAGGVLDAALIEKINAANNGQSHVCVSATMYREISKKAILRYPVITVSEKLEQETGYAEIKNDATGLLEEIARTTAVPKEAIITMSDEIYHNDLFSSRV